MALVEADVLGTELEKVRPTIPQMFDRECTFYSTIEKKNVEVVSARDMRIPLELSPGGSFGYVDIDGGDLGVAGGPKFDKAVISTLHLRHGVQWTKKAEWATDDARKAVLNTVKHLLAKAMPQFRRDVDAICMGAGDGVVATITSKANAGGKDTYTCTTDGFGAKLVRVGQKVNVYLAALNALRDVGGSGTEVEIDQVDIPNKTIRVAATVTGSAATDKLLSSGLSGATPVGMYGVAYHHNNASTGSWLGFNRADYPQVRANRVTASAYLSLPMPRLALNLIGDRLGFDQMPKVTAWMHPCQKQQYEELGQLVSVIQKQASAEALDLYFGDNMQMAGAGVKTSYLWDKKRIDFIYGNTWGRAVMKEADFYEVDGRKTFELRHVTTGGVVTSQIFYIVASFNLFVDNPGACSYISDLTVPTGY